MHNHHCAAIHRDACKFFDAEVRYCTYIFLNIRKIFVNLHLIMNVENTKELVVTGRDEQLEAAVKALLEQIDSK